MAAGSSVELDFFRMEKETAFAQTPTPKLFERKRSFRDIQRVISKINPEVVKAVIASGSANAVTTENCVGQSPMAGKKKHRILSSPLLLYKPIYSYAHQTSDETAPMTIFYNGAVTVFDVPHQQAESILKVAEEAAGPEANPDFKTNPFAENEGLPLIRTKSLRRFLQKRKQRQDQCEGGSIRSKTSNAPSSPNAWSPEDDDDKEKEDEDIVA